MSQSESDDAVDASLIRKRTASIKIVGFLEYLKTRITSSQINLTPGVLQKFKKILLGNFLRVMKRF